jgi:hypothetical protein
VGAVKVGAVEKLVELVAFGSVKDLLESNDIGVESPQLAVDASDTSRITLVVLDVDRENS